MSFENWLTFCAIETLLCFTPGPAVLVVVSVTIARGAGPGVSAAMGVLAANTLYFAISALGVVGVLLASSQFFAVLKCVGAAYLVVVGLRMLLSQHHPTLENGDDGLRGPFLRGLVVQGANPKALMFFVAILPQFVNPAEPVAQQILILGASSVVIEFVALNVFALAAASTRKLVGERLSSSLQRLGGGLLVAAGVRLAFDRSN